jgi:hypothetical protein
VRDAGIGKSAQDFLMEVGRESEQRFGRAWNDVYSIALGRCIAVPAEQAAAAHDAQPYETPDLEVLRPYQGYYSGWTGQI